MSAKYETTPDRLVQGFKIAALLGAALIALGTLPLSIGMVVLAYLLIAPGFLPLDIGEFVIAYLLAFMIFGLGLLIGPLWALVHCLRWRNARPTRQQASFFEWVFHGFQKYL